MNELSTLRTLRENVVEPSGDELKAAFDKLAVAMRSAESAKRRPRFARTRWVLASTAAVALVGVVAGNIHVSAESADAASTLMTIAGETVTYADPVPSSGEYLLARTHAQWPQTTLDENNNTVRIPNEQVIEIYQPANPADDWVMYRDWGAWQAVTQEGSIEIIRAKNGEFYGPGHWLTEDLAEIPEGDGAEVLAYFDEKYVGGSVSRDEDNFERIASILRSGLVPAEIRARLFAALANIPGVSATPDIENLDGVKGVAIGRTEFLRGGMRAEIILDPKTGLVIGERSISSVAIFGYGFNEIASLTAITTTVASEAPAVAKP